MSKRNLLIIALLLSVGVNLFFVGGIGYRMSSRPEIGARPFPPNVGWIVRDLSEERRDELMPMLQQSSDEIRSTRGEMFLAQRRVNDLMAASELNETALAQAFADLREANARYQAQSHQQTISILSQLSEEERQAAVEFVQRRGPRDGRGGFPRREGGPGFGLDEPRPGGVRPGGPPPADAPPNPDQ